jgi:hypothetical protein
MTVNTAIRMEKSPSSSSFNYMDEQTNGGNNKSTPANTTTTPSSRNFNNINWSNHSNSEHQTYAGYLKKQGALFKQWKERYFVLDSVKHQVNLL